ncbi:uncharacterized protein LOC129592293 [Paramacrobiotus metropolitanus]|uniref:uncharacterized protein LOC129592293 n=1 Tax=Paramacrobiotus metropolitanus TaxID=2943436 RepID=UPI002445FCA0|nr:uncharacterized protein LOC129592293 [Paramacrobiotus metropolitanus]XP_055344270.1 uncharacterized protein LOC129592293 [Paramacrobiotus metropolitanus]
MPPDLADIPRNAEPQRDNLLNADGRSEAILLPSGQAFSTSGPQNYPSVLEKTTTDLHAWDIYNLTPAERQEILHLYDNGFTLSYILQKTNLSLYHLKRLLCAAGRTGKFRKGRRKRVDKIIQDAGLTLDAPPPRTFLLDSASQNDNIKKRNKWSRRRKWRDPWIGRPAVEAAGGASRPSSREGSRTAGDIISDVPDGEETGRYTAETGTAKDRSAPKNHIKIPEADGKIDIEFQDSPVQNEQHQPITEGRSRDRIWPEESVFNASEPLLHPLRNPSISGHSARYQFQFCRLSWDEEEAFLLHPTEKDHEQLSATGNFLYCTGCKFKTRKPAKMGQHVINYQSQGTLRDGNMHSVKFIP